jgi:DNA-binding MarR family transcriptional regulator
LLGVTRQFVNGKIVLDEAVGFVVYRAHQAMRQEMYRRFARLGLEMTPEQWAVLVRLWERDGRTQNDLSEVTLRDKHTISRMLDGMEARGWLVRRADPGDGRGRLVFLTQAGLALEAQLVPLARELVADVLRGIDAQDLQVTLRTLRQMGDNLADEP